MSTSITSTATPSQHEFERRVEAIRPSKSDINNLILDYLIAEGYPSAASRFSQETNLLAPRETIKGSDKIKLQIYAGDIESAIDAINELNPMILEFDEPLHFALLRLQLIELIRQTCYVSKEQDFAPAIAFASTHLAPRASTNPQFLDDLEKTMALILFPPDQLEQQQIALLASGLRKDVADRVNKAILVAFRQTRDARIRDLVRLRQWSEDTARTSRKNLPEKLDIGLHEENDDESRVEPMEI